MINFLAEYLVYLIAYLFCGFVSALLFYFLVQEYGKKEIVCLALDVERDSNYQDVASKYDNVMECKRKHPYLLFSLIVLTAMPFLLYIICSGLLTGLFKSFKKKK